MDTPFICKMCGVEAKEWGNNPQPLLENPHDRVCDDCDKRFVLPARILGLKMNRISCDLLVEIAKLGRTMLKRNAIKLGSSDNQNITPEQLAEIRAMDDFDLTMVLSEIHDHGWSYAVRLLPLIAAETRREKARSPSH